MNFEYELQVFLLCTDGGKYAKNTTNILLREELGLKNLASVLKEDRRKLDKQTVQCVDMSIL